MTDFEYANGASGSCQECGEATDEPWHAYCPSGYAQEQGWDAPGGHPAALTFSVVDERFVRLLQRMHELERRVERLERDAYGPEAVMAP
jgi:hypothetical protein